MAGRRPSRGLIWPSGAFADTMPSPLIEAHIPRVVEIHLQNLRDDLFATLGRKFLEGAVYPALLHPASGGFGYVQVREERVVGFIAGTLSTPSWHRALIGRRPLECSAAAVRGLFMGWEHASRMARRLFWPEAGPSARGGGEILFLAVEGPYQGRGLAFKLIGSFLGHCRSHGLRFCSVSTSEANTASRRLYERFGFRALREVEISGRRRLLYRLDLDTP